MTTVITAKHKATGKITFRAREYRKLTQKQINKILAQWHINKDKEEVEVIYV